MYLHLLQVAISNGNTFDPVYALFGFHSVYEDLQAALDANQSYLSTRKDVYVVPYLCVTGGTYPSLRYIPLSGNLNGVNVVNKTCTGYVQMSDGDGKVFYKSFSNEAFIHKIVP